MSNDDKTLRDLVLDNTTRLVNMASDISALKQSVESIKTSVSVMNHNSTEMADRLTSLETTRTEDRTTMSTLKKLGYVGFTICASIGGADLILHLLHVI